MSKKQKQELDTITFDDGTEGFVHLVRQIGAGRIAPEFAPEWTRTHKERGRKIKTTSWGYEVYEAL